MIPLQLHNCRTILWYWPPRTPKSKHLHLQTHDVFGPCRCDSCPSSASFSRFISTNRSAKRVESRTATPLLSFTIAQAPRVLALLETLHSVRCRRPYLRLAPSSSASASSSSSIPRLLVLGSEQNTEYLEMTQHSGLFRR